MSRDTLKISKNKGHSNLSFDFAQDGEPAEPFRISDFGFRIFLFVLLCLSALKKSLSTILLFMLIICCLLVTGCGYRFRKAGVPIGVALDTIAIPLFPTTSSFVGYEADFTRILREEFITHSRVRIVSKENAQAVLSGSIYSIITEPLTYRVRKQTIHGFVSTDEITRSREMRVRVEAKLTDRETGTILWEDGSFTRERSFSVSSDPLRTRYNQRKAFIAIAQDIATRIYSKTMERF
jgi:outer membrane lipopolysaccharide assembly protein LptE/RlpB